MSLAGSATFTLLPYASLLANIFPEFKGRAYFLAIEYQQARDYFHSRKTLEQHCKASTQALL